MSFGCSGTIVNAGAATWGNGTTGITGFVTASNSLVGSSANDRVGSIMVLSNGNYIVANQLWDCLVASGCLSDMVDVGAVTWAKGDAGVTGFVNVSNSLVGSAANDKLGLLSVALSNGNYVIGTGNWDSTASTDVGLAAVVNGSADIYGIMPK